MDTRTYVMHHTAIVDRALEEVPIEQQLQRLAHRDGGGLGLVADNLRENVAPV